jgi:lipopolysaccharide/colanic/teichoic acid biosynthesis glycosyltransferase
LNDIGVEPLLMYRRWVKRCLDVLLAVASMPVTAPLLMGIAVLVRMKLGPPVLFRQKRPGFHGRGFTLYKFRTMTNATGPDGSLLPDSERLTRFGRFLRSTSLDELPELINVFKGDMSLVGPRPLLMEYLGRYSPEQARRHEVKPGVTGWAQINGREGICWEERFKLDVWYVDNLSIWLDIKIILLTIIITIKREGIVPPVDAAMDGFMGSKNR